MANDQKDPPTYHVFRRTTDIVITIGIVGGLLLGLFKWFYQKPVDMETKIDNLTTMMTEQKEAIENLSAQLDGTNRRLSDFQKSFKIGRPGHWTIQGDGWKWADDNSKSK